MRLGLGHGAILDFSGEEGALGIIPPDRASRSGLDYLALGDWHGQVSVGARTWYPGTPEADGFGPRRGGALLVGIAGRGAPAEVTRVETGTLTWTRVLLDLLPGEDGALILDRALPALRDRATTLLELVARGRTSLGAQAALARGAGAAGPDFLWHRVDLSALEIEQTPEDLDLIAVQGALRSAAEALAAEASGAPEAARRDAARGALARLYAYQQEVG